MANRPNASEALKARRDYAEAFDRTMIKIWREKIRALRIIDSGSLLRSTAQFIKNFDNDVISLRYGFQFAEYGIYQERGTGRGVFRGNHGDIGRRNKRKRRPWMSRKYLASVYNIREFLAENLGQQVVSIVDSIGSPANP